MSVSSLIAQHGVTVDVLTPTASIGANGSLINTYAPTSQLVAFVQPRAAADSDFAGAPRMRVGATFYFAGQQSFDTDAVFSITDGQYAVRSVRIPILRPSAADNCHTIVEADRVNGLTFPYAENLVDL